MPADKKIDITEEDMMGEVADLPSEEPPHAQTPDVSCETDTPHDFNKKENTEKYAHEITTLHKALTDLEEKWKRAMAESQNIHHRAEKRIADAHQYGISKLLEALIPVLDSFEQSLQQALFKPEASEETSSLSSASNMATTLKTLQEGTALIFQMFLKTLENFGVKAIDPVAGEMFDPQKHEVIATQRPESNEGENTAGNTIIKVVQKGYQLHERLIRPARVIIVQKTA